MVKQCELFAPTQPASMVRTATLSPCGRYRYDLTRTWREPPRSMCLFVMLNPSTADGSTDDPTVRKCVGFARKWGHDGLVIVNLFAWRATDPMTLFVARKAGEHVSGPDNLRFVMRRAGQASRIVCAWGSRADGDDSTNVLNHLDGRDLWCLGRTASGQPRHPLMLAYETPLERYYP